MATMPGTLRHRRSRANDVSPAGLCRRRSQSLLNGHACRLEFYGSPSGGLAAQLLSPLQRRRWRSVSPSKPYGFITALPRLEERQRV